MSACATSGWDASATCGNAKLTVHNNTLSTRFVVIPRLAALPGGVCLGAPGFTPSISNPGDTTSVSVPTLSSSGGSTPPGGGDVGAYYPYSASERVSYVDVTLVPLPASASSVTTSDVSGLATGMYSYLTTTLGASLSEMITTSFAVNTCGGNSYVVSGGDSRTVHINKKVSLSTVAAAHPDRTGGADTVLVVYLDDLVDGPGGEEPYTEGLDLSTNEDQYLLAWLITVGVAAALAIALAVIWHHYHLVKPVTAAELKAHSYRVQRGTFDAAAYAPRGSAGIPRLDATGMYGEGVGLGADLRSLDVGQF